MTFVVVFEGERQVMGMFGPFTSDDDAQEFRETNFPRHVTEMHDAMPAF